MGCLNFIFSFFKILIRGISVLLSLLFILLIVISGPTDPYIGSFYLLLFTSILVFGLTFMPAYLMGKRCTRFVEYINKKENLCLDYNKYRILGYPAFTFFAFDTTHRKLAICNSFNGDYKIRDFSWVLSWKIDTDTTTYHTTSLRPQTITRCSVVFHVADTQIPGYRTGISAFKADFWEAQLTAIFN